jgi:hypothetical protein
MDCRVSQDELRNDEHLQNEAPTNRTEAIAAFTKARAAFLAALANGDSDKREIVIDDLIQSECFWDAVFKLGNTSDTDYNAMFSGAIAISAAVSTYSTHGINQSMGLPF